MDLLIRFIDYIIHVNLFSYYVLLILIFLT